MLELVTACAALLAPQDPAATIAELCARSNGVARSESIGRSRGDRSIDVVILSAPGTAEPVARPGVLVVAGCDGTRPVDRDLALWQCQKLVDDFAAGDAATRTLLEECVVWIVPALNPDGLALARHGNAQPLDLDRDGKTDEDAPADLDGDGVIAQMRWLDDAGDLIPDPNEPRLLRTADKNANERPTHGLAVEARDIDGDEARGEDDAQGIAIDRTFPHRWDEFDRRTGAFPTSEPETKALADFCFAHRNLCVAFVWGRDDNLLETPKVKEPKERVPLDGILAGDEKLFERAGKLYRDKTGRAGDARARMDGSPWSWLYLHIGVPAFAADVWRPAAREGEDKKDPLRDAKRRLAQCDAGARGFVPWHAFEHPELGAVEIGGFVAEDETALLPATERDALFAAHHAFFVEACTWRPKMRIAKLTAKPLGGGAHELLAVIVNDGALAALTGTGEQCRRFALPRVVLSGAVLLAGRDRERLDNLGPLGGRQELRWVVAGDAGTRIALELIADPIGGDRAEVTL